MKVINSFAFKNFTLACLVLVFGFACKNNMHEVKENKPTNSSHKTVKSDSVLIPYKRVVVNDSLNKQQVATDTTTFDSTANHLQETARKLDIRYFKKSFNLHRKTFITYQVQKTGVYFYKQDEV